MIQVRACIKPKGTAVSAVPFLRIYEELKEKLKMEIIERNIESIRPYENNPRHNDGAVDTVAKSIQQFGWKQPIVIDKNGVIVAGHTRYKAAQVLGCKTVPCVIADDLTDEEVRAYRLADNKVAELSYWNFEKLDEELAGIFDIDMEDLGFGTNAYDIPKIQNSGKTENNENKELSLEDFGDDKFEHECPRCGFKF